MTSWGGYVNRLRVGVDMTLNHNPTNADPYVTLSWSTWAQTNYSTYNYDINASWSGAVSGSSTRRASNSTALRTGEGSFNVTASYDSALNYTIHTTASGTGAGPVSHSATGTVPRRPTANPSVPRNVTLVPAVGAGKLTLTFSGPSSWPGPSSGRRYYWQISTVSNFATTTSTGYQTGGTLNISGTAGVRYYVRVRSEGVWWDATRVSSWVTVNALAPTAPVLAGTPAPTNVARNSWTVPTATISNNGGQAPSNYRVMVNTTPVDTTNIKTQGAWAAVSPTGAQPDTVYYYKVSAYNYAGWGPWTEWREMRTLDDAPDDPAAPVISAITETTATATWVAPPASGATITGYDLVISDTSNPNVPVVAYLGLGPTVLSQAITGLTKAHDYQAYVRANGTPAGSGWSPAGEFRTTGTLATMFPKINDSGTWKDFELWEKQAGVWKKVQLQVNDGGVWKWSPE